MGLGVTTTVAYLGLLVAGQGLLWQFERLQDLSVKFVAHGRGVLE